MLDRLGNSEAALDAADKAVSSAREATGIHEMAKTLVIRAQILEHRGDHLAAKASRREATALLEGEQLRGIAQNLLSGGETITERDDGHAEVAEQLSTKELEVLRLLGTHLSRLEIGSRLFISLNTVKTHQRAVYRKLGVDNRTAAVQRARQLGLL
jgi:LuxR family maltose regulon positive regulatory protein